jgi:hypothetical protein
MLSACAGVLAAPASKTSCKLMVVMMPPRIELACRRLYAGRDTNSIQKKRAPKGASC